MDHLKTPVSILQEMMAKKAAPLPVYHMDTQSDIPSNGRFRCTVQCVDTFAVGFATNKKEAKHEAARNALQQLGYRSARPPAGPTALVSPVSAAHTTPTNFLNYVGQLNEHVLMKGLCGYPKYTYDVDFRSGGFVANCAIDGVAAQSAGMTKKEAKQRVAQMMLELLDKIGTTASANKLIKKTEINIDTEKIIKKFEQLSTTTIVKPQETCGVPSIEIDEVDNKQSIEDLKRILHKKNIFYAMRTIRRPKACITIITVNNSTITHLGYGATKEIATHEALKQAIFVARIGFSGTFTNTQ